MQEKQNYRINRKEFLERASAGLLAFGVARQTGIRADRGSDTRTLGRTALEVPPLGFGASRTMEDSLLKFALEQGIRFIDTGRAYYNGQNEIMVGRVVGKRRQDVVIQSKARIHGRDDTEIVENLEDSLNKSMKALGTDYIDILLLHGVSSPEILSREAIRAFFEKAKKSGKIRAAGFSCHDRQIEVLKALRADGFYDVVMVPFNHRGAFKHSRSGRHGEWDAVALDLELRRLHQGRIGIVAMKTCSGGPYAAPGEKRATYRAAVNWVLGHDYIGAAAVAMGDLDQIEENLGAA
jgi:aryl-alcohol dehydrogenase-like predicted oxidoreductase